MWTSNFSREYDLELPFVSAGMGFLALPRLVAAVSEAGGLGLLGVSPAPAASMREMIMETRSLTSRPFGVDLIFENTAFGPSTTEEHIDVCVAERVPVVVFFWNQPPDAWIARLHGAGVKVWMTVGSVRQAREAVGSCVDALIAQGSEAGGHNKSILGLSTLVPAVKDAVGGVPVVAAGGIADGRGVAAAFALGADAVCVGTRLVASREAYAHDEYKRRIVGASVDEVTRTSIFGPEWPDQPMKVIRNRVVEEWADRSEETPAIASPDTIGSTVLFGRDYAMPKFSAVLPTPPTKGDFEEMCIAAGESAGLVTGIASAGEIVRNMMSEAAEIIAGRLSDLLK
jgi:NAD(P)H-dependent flavin oxidoreductase YrpB (nitropropane dioxygenase family)